MTRGRMRTGLGMAVGVLLLVSTPAHAKPVKGKAPATKDRPATPPPAVQTNLGDPQAFIRSLYEHLTALTAASTSVPQLHQQIAIELLTIVDYSEMARLSLAQRWEAADEAKRLEFTKLLREMVVNSYVRRWKPGAPVEMVVTGAPRALADGKVHVATTVKVDKTAAEVAYALVPRQGRWWVYDIVVDGASQVQSYRLSFGRIVDKEGWDGLMVRMRKAAAKKAP